MEQLNLEYFVEVLIPNGPDGIEWDLFDTYRQWGRALSKAQELTDKGYGVHIVTNEGDTLFESEGR